MRPVPKLLWTYACILISAWAAPVFAGTAQSTFAVQINLRNPVAGSGGPDICTSQTLSASTNATVKVICGTNIFVSIEPSPTVPFVGVHGGAFSFMLEPTSLLIQSTSLSDDPLGYMGAGTITTMHVFHDDDRGNDTMEMLVSF